MKIVVSVVIQLVLAYLSPSTGEGLIARKKFTDGEESLYVSLGDLFGKLTLVPRYDRIKLKEVSDGVRIIAAIYVDDVLEDCEITKNQREAAALESEVEEMIRTTNGTETVTDSEEFPWLDFSRFAGECRIKERSLSNYAHKRQRRSLLQTKPRRHSRNKYFYRTRHDRLAAKKYHFKQSMITPGTNWCGPNNRARHYNDHGIFAKADKCCKKHDTCDKSISPFSHKYALINKDFFTLSHCSCDRRFRKCLKLADTGASKFVGKLFFNFIQTKCFVTKTEKICTKRNWRGKCKSSSYEVVGRIRDNVLF